MSSSSTPSEPDPNELEVLHYLFELRGYAIVEQALEADEVIKLNQIIDDQLLPPPTTYNRFGSAPLGTGFLGWDNAFLPLIDHPCVFEAVKTGLDADFVLTNIHGIYEDKFIGNTLSTGFERQPADERACIVEWSLSDTGPGIGGLQCIPGSHRVNAELPDTIRSQADSSSCVTTPSVPAGSAIVYTNALLHDYQTWHGPHQRRTLVFVYKPKSNLGGESRITINSKADISDSQRVLLG